MTNSYCYTFSTEVKSLLEGELLDTPGSFEDGCDELENGGEKLSVKRKAKPKHRPSLPPTTPAVAASSYNPAPTTAAATPAAIPPPVLPASATLSAVLLAPKLAASPTSSCRHLYHHRKTQMEEITCDLNHETTYPSTVKEITSQAITGKKSFCCCSSYS